MATEEFRLHHGNGEYAVLKSEVTYEVHQQKDLSVKFLESSESQQRKYCVGRLRLAWPAAQLEVLVDGVHITPAHSDGQRVSRAATSVFKLDQSTRKTRSVVYLRPEDSVSLYDEVLFVVKVGISRGKTGKAPQDIYGPEVQVQSSAVQVDEEDGEELPSGGPIQINNSMTSTHLRSKTPTQASNAPIIQETPATALRHVDKLNPIERKARIPSQHNSYQDSDGIFEYIEDEDSQARYEGLITSLNRGHELGRSKHSIVSNTKQAGLTPQAIALVSRTSFVGPDYVMSDPVEQEKTSSPAVGPEEEETGDEDGNHGDVAGIKKIEADVAMEINDGNEDQAVGEAEYIQDVETNALQPTKLETFSRHQAPSNQHRRIESEDSVPFATADSVIDESKHEDTRGGSQLAIKALEHVEEDLEDGPEQEDKIGVLTKLRNPSLDVKQGKEVSPISMTEPEKKNIGRGKKRKISDIAEDQEEDESHVKETRASSRNSLKIAAPSKAKARASKFTEEKEDNEADDEVSDVSISRNKNISVVISNAGNPHESSARGRSKRTPKSKPTPTPKSRSKSNTALEEESEDELNGVGSLENPWKAPRIVFSNSSISSSTNSKSSVLKWARDHSVTVIEKCTSKGDWDMCIIGDGKVLKTSKLLMSLVLSKVIVMDAWLAKSAAANKFLDPARFLAKDLDLSIDRKVLFKGKKVFITPSLRKDLKTGYTDIEQIITAAGGTSVVSKPMRDAKEMNGFIILALEKDDLESITFMNNGFECYTKDLLSNSVYRGVLDLDDDEFKIVPKLSQSKQRKGRKD